MEEKQDETHGVSLGHLIENSISGRMQRYVCSIYCCGSSAAACAAVIAASKQYDDVLSSRTFNALYS